MSQDEYALAAAVVYALGWALILLPSERQQFAIGERLLPVVKWFARRLSRAVALLMD